MYRKTAAIILAGASAAVAQNVPATRLDSATIMRAEQAAIRYALEGDSKPARIIVDPRVAVNAMAPGRGTTLRPVWRTDSLAAFLKGTSRERDKVITCASRTSMGPRCDLIDADVFVTSSEPRFDGGLATVTVTLERKGLRGEIYYETLNIVMANTSAGWKLMKREQLGIS